MVKRLNLCATATAQHGKISVAQIRAQVASQNGNGRRLRKKPLQHDFGLQIEITVRTAAVLRLTITRTCSADDACV